MDSLRLHREEEEEEEKHSNSMNERKEAMERGEKHTHTYTLLILDGTGIVKMHNTKGCIKRKGKHNKVHTYTNTQIDETTTTTKQYTCSNTRDKQKSRTYIMPKPPIQKGNHPLTNERGSEHEGEGDRERDRKNVVRNLIITD